MGKTCLSCGLKLANQNKIGYCYPHRKLSPIIKNVQGLHVPWNLRVITRKENCSKHTKVGY